MYPKKYYSNFYLYIFPLIFLLFIMVVGASNLFSSFYDQNIAIYIMLVFAGPFFMLLAIFLWSINVVIIDKEKLVFKNLLFNARDIVYFEELVNIEFKHFARRKKTWSSNPMSSGSVETQYVLFQFFDNTEYELNLNGYWESDELMTEIRMLFNNAQANIKANKNPSASI
jgi:hypothetical protein